MGALTPSVRTDVIAIGSSLGALAAASFLARAGLRVVMLEEETQGQRPPLLREPFLLTGLATGEPIDLLLRDLTVPLLERRELRREEVASQVILPGSRIDVGGGRSAVARELESYGLCEARVARRWLDEIDASGDDERALLSAPAPLAAPASPLERFGGARLGARRGPPPPPAPPPELLPFVAAQLAACSGLQAPTLTPAAALLLRAPRDGGFVLPSAARRFLDLFRRRFLACHGEIRSVGRFGLEVEGGDVSALLPRQRLFARAAIIGAPRDLLCRHVEGVAPPPRCLRGMPAPIEVPTYLLRAQSAALPIGMASRLVAADGEKAEQVWWLARMRDADDAASEWITLRGPGAAGAPWEAPLAKLAPFSEGRVIPVPVGPTPSWDRDGVELRFSEPRAPLLLKRKPPIVAAGPEVAPELGVEGELLLARRVAEHLIERLDAPRKGL